MRMIRAAGGLLVVTAIGLAGCTTTLSGRSAPGQGTPAGFAYQLPVVTYELESTRLLAACPDAGETLTFEAAVKANSTVVPGPVVILDHEALGDAFKTTDATFQRHPSGMIKSVNVTVQDHTGEAVTAGFKAIVGIGKLAMGVAIPAPGVASTAGPNARGYVVCSDLGKSRVATYEKAKKNVETATEALAAATEALANFDADHALDNPRAPETNTKRETLATAVRAAKKTLEGVTKAYNASKAKLVVTRQITFTPKPDGREKDELTASEGDFVRENLQLMVIPPQVAGQPAPKPAYARFNADLTLDPTGIPPGYGPVFETARQEFLKQATIEVTSRPVTVATADGLAPQTDVCGAGEALKRCGVIYYTAATGRLQVCQQTSGVDCAALPASDKKVLLRNERTIPQFGRRVSLSLRNGAWSNNALTASFTEDGLIEQASYKKQAAEAVGALNSLNTGVDAATELAVYKANTAVRLAQRQQARDTAALSALNANTSLITAQQVRDAGVAKAVDDALFAQELAAATRDLRMQKAIDEAALAAKTAGDAVTTSELEQVQTDTTLINAYKTKLEAEKALEALRKAP